jgi:transcription elongation factor Elf1
MKAKTEAVKNTFPCALCKQELVRRTDKKNKPYFVCDECGTQYFIRYRSGIAKLEALMQAAPKARKNHAVLSSNTVSEVGEQLDQIDDALDVIDEEDNLCERNAQGEWIPFAIPEWIQHRTAQIRSLLNLK